MTSSDVFQAVDDSIYSNSLRTAPVSTMSKNRESYIVTTPNAYGTITEPLNSPANAKAPIFEISGSQCKTMNFSQCALKLNMVFTQMGRHDKPVPQLDATKAFGAQNLKTNKGMLFNSPEWNMVGDLIKSISLHMNKQLI